MNKTGYIRGKGSKREQGIITPKMPHRLACGCEEFKGVIRTLCRPHLILKQRREAARLKRLADEQAQKQAERKKKNG